MRLYAEAERRRLEMEHASARLRRANAELEEFATQQPRPAGAVADDRKLRAPVPRAGIADGSTIPGTGIGLALAGRILERHRGRNWSDSQPGVGPTFYFSLP